MFKYKEILKELKLTEGIIENDINILIGSKYLCTSFIHLLKEYYLYLSLSKKNEEKEKLLNLVDYLINLEDKKLVKNAIIFDLKETYLTNKVCYSTTYAFLDEENSQKENIIRKRNKEKYIENIRIN